MSSPISDNSVWIQDLPHFEGIFENQVSAILPFFGRLGIPFFRKTSGPPAGSVEPIIDLADGTIEEERPDTGRVEKAFISFQAYILHAKTRLAENGESESEEQDGMKECLSEGYLRGFYLACAARKVDRAAIDYLQVAKDCLIGLRILAPRLSPTTVRSLEHNIVSATFGDTTLSPRFIAILFRQTRALTATLQQHHLQRPGQKGISVDKANIDPVAANEEEAVPLLELLDGFISLSRVPERLSGNTSASLKQTKKAQKERDEQDRARPGRVVLEALIAKCELSMVLASLDMTRIKARALRCHPTPVIDATDDKQSIADTDSRHSLDDEHDIKPTVPPTTKAEGADSEDETPAAMGSACQDQLAGMEHWEDQAERCLLECLREAASLAKSRHSKTLREVVRPADWLDESSTQTFHSRHSSRSDADSTDTSYADDDSETTLSDSTAPDESDSAGTARPAPLRAIFRLQDRYEELRLAVWLSLPTESRGKMSAFMRGIPTAGQEKAMRDSGMTEEEVIERKAGQVGRAWDQLGLLLLKDFDPDALSMLGLDLEKLDKWQDLASVSGGKKTKKGRKTI